MISQPAPKLFVRSIRGRLALLVLAITVPAAVLVAVLTRQAYENELAAVARHLLVTTRTLATLVERKFDASEALLRSLESLPALEHDDIPSFEARVRATVPGRNQWVVLLDATGHQLVNTRLSPGAPLPLSGQESDFWAALRGGQRYVSNVFVGAVAREPVLSVSVPVMRHGMMKYALTLVMLPSALAEAIAMDQISQGEIMAVVDRKGTVAARSRGAERFVGMKATPDMVAAVTSQSSGVIESVTLEGIPTISAFSRCPTIGWTAAMGAPRAEIYASAQSLLRLAATWSAVLIGLAGLAAVWIWRSVVRGMDVLVLETERAGAGNVSPGRLTGLEEIDRVAMVLRDTAERLSLRERDLKHLNETLEERVATRTSELAAANTALVSANRELDDFARVASHDLREPLRSISAFAEIVREENGAQLDETGRSYLDRVCAATKRLSSLLDSILAYSKASSAPLATFETVDLNETVAEVQQDCLHRLTSTRGRIEAGKLGSVCGDPKQLHQLLLNLISNALKFHRPGVPPVVTIQSRRKGRMLHLTVTDNGIGFAQSAADRIFAPFERVDRSYEGSGVGLAIVRRIAERHGGTVCASSTPGVGSRFEVILPIEPA